MICISPGGCNPDDGIFTFHYLMYHGLAEFRKPGTVTTLEIMRNVYKVPRVFSPEDSSSIIVHKDCLADFPTNLKTRPIVFTKLFHYRWKTGSWKGVPETVEKELKLVRKLPPVEAAPISAEDFVELVPIDYVEMSQSYKSDLKKVDFNLPGEVPDTAMVSYKAVREHGCASLASHHFFEDHDFEKIKGHFNKRFFHFSEVREAKC